MLISKPLNLSVGRRERLGGSGGGSASKKSQVRTFPLTFNKKYLSYEFDYQTRHKSVSSF